MRGSLLPALRRSLARSGLFASGEVAVLAVSGGPDSLCLLHVFANLDAALGPRLHVAHVHHGLRGADADADAAFVAEQAAAHGLPCTILYLDPRSFAQGGRGRQEGARVARYAALRELAAALGGGCVVTAHTEDDQAETVLLHLLRGSGLDGLAGMRPRQGDLVRPFLGVSRAAIEAHSAAHGLHPRQDASNQSRAYRRNALRLEALPLLEQFNPRLRPALARTAAILARDADYLRGQAAAALETLLLPAAPHTLALDRERLAILDPALRPHVLRMAVERLCGTPGGLSARQLDSLDTLACAGHAGMRGDLPRGLRADTAGGRLLLRVGDERAASLPETVPLPIPGTARFGDWRLRATVLPAGEDQGGDAEQRLPRTGRGPIKGILTAWCDGDAMGAPLVIRARRPGDRLRPLGLHGSKKVQDLLVDRKVARTEREGVPIVTGPRGIIWVVGHALEETAARSAASRVTVVLQAWQAAKDGDDPWV